MIPGTEYALKKLADLAFERLSETLKNEQSRSRGTSDSLEMAIKHHMKDAENWSSEISFADLRAPKQTSEAFVPLDLLLQPRRLRVTANEKIEVRPLEEVLSKMQGHVVILGHPGAGKTTSMKHLCHRLLHEEEFLPELNFPVIVRLRELKTSLEPLDPDSAGTNILISSLLDLFDIEINPLLIPPRKDPNKADSSRKLAFARRRSLQVRTLVNVIDTLCVLIIFDGFDEISSAEVRDSVIEDIRELATHLETSRMILTSRTGEFHYHIENSSHFEIHPLTNEQMVTFASRWLGHGDGLHLIEQIQVSPFGDTAIRPLTLAHLCAIYERIGSIPEKPKTVYRKIVSLLLEKWDEERSVKRRSAYAKFDLDRKLEFLAQLAFTLTQFFRSTLFTRSELLRAYGHIHDNFSLPKEDAPHVVRELESHTGLFLESGNELYEFSHKSLQEYLAAEFIVRLPSIPDEKAGLLELPNELAIATAISSRPSEYLTQLVTQRLRSVALRASFIRAFVSRLLLEQPDLEHTSRISATLLSLYSYYVEAILREKNSSSINNGIEGRDFEGLSQLLLSRIAIADIRKIYRVTEIVNVGDGRKVSQMTMVNRMAHQDSSDFRATVEVRKNWPSRISIFESLLAEKASN